MGQEAEAESRLAPFRPYAIDDALVAVAADDVVVMHCLPAHRGEEIAASVIDGPHSIVFDQAENRLHAQKALLAFLLDPHSVVAG
jgi:ornithine carbamoyltransferase